MNYLKDYQTAHNILADGIIGKGTAKILMEELKIESVIALSHFLAQVQHESGNFSAGREKLNYSAEALVKLFGKHFQGAASRNYARQPEAIANRLYANRMGNGDEVSGEGWKYRGTAALQLTGKTNIQSYLKSVNLPLDTDPNVLLLPAHYFNTAKWFFDTNNVWKYCTKIADDSILAVSRFINLGSPSSKGTPIGLTERTTLTRKYLALLG